MKRIIFLRSSLMIGAVVLALCANVHAMDRGYGYGGGSSGGFDPFRFERGYQAFEKADAELTRLRALPRTALGDVRIAQQEAIVENLHKKISGRQEFTPAQALVRGFLGNDSAYFDDSGVANIGDALYKGLLFAVAKETGAFLSLKIRGVLQDKLGVVFDNLVNSVSDFVEQVQQAYVHDGYQPFDKDKLMMWQAGINTTIIGIEGSIKAYQKSVSSGQDMTMRNAPSVEGDGSDVSVPRSASPTTVIDVESVDFAAVPIHNEQQKIQIFERVWPNVFGRPVVSLAYFSSILEARKGYYDADSEEVMFASRIQLALKDLSLMLMCVTSAADVDNYLGPSAPAIPFMRGNIDNLFKMLLLCTERRSITPGTTNQPSLYERNQKATPSRSSRLDQYEPSDHGY